MRQSWNELFAIAYKKMNTFGAEKLQLAIDDPVSLSELEKIEKQLGYQLPMSFKNILLNFSGAVDFNWFLNDEIKLPNEFKNIFSGGCSWNIEKLIEIDEAKNSWITGCFNNPEDDYDKVWYEKLAFLEVPNGDFIAFDLKDGTDASVVYLSHDDGEGHGYVLGENFELFVQNWVKLGCPGPEDWQMLTFIKDKEVGIDAELEASKRWLTLLDSASK